MTEAYCIVTHFAHVHSQVRLRYKSIVMAKVLILYLLKLVYTTDSRDKLSTIGFYIIIFIISRVDLLSLLCKLLDRLIASRVKPFTIPLIYIIR